MNPFERKISRLKQRLENVVPQYIKPNLKMILEAEKEFQKDLIEMQLDKGIDSLGRNLPKYKKGKYGDRKKARNPNSRGRYDLKNEGDYRDFISIQISDKELKYSSTDKKHAFLSKLRGVGLNDNSKKRLIKEKIKPLLGGQKLKKFLLS